jgi:hypothetical protein
MTLPDLTDDELLAEVARRRLSPRCPCGKWQTYLGAWDQDGRTWRCHGCLRALGKCRCDA